VPVGTLVGVLVRVKVLAGKLVCVIEGVIEGVLEAVNVGVIEGDNVAVLVIVFVAVLVDVLEGVRVGVVAGPQPAVAMAFNAAGALIRTTSSIHRSKLYGAPVWPCVCHCIVSTLASAMARVTSVLPHPSCEKSMLAKSIDTFCHDVVAVKT
jgi:hypothetical protein